MKTKKKPANKRAYSFCTSVPAEVAAWLKKIGTGTPGSGARKLIAAAFKRAKQ